MLSVEVVVVVAEAHTNRFPEMRSAVVVLAGLTPRKTLSRSFLAHLTPSPLDLEG